MYNNICLKCGFFLILERFWHKAHKVNILSKLFYRALVGPHAINKPDYLFGFFNLFWIHMPGREVEWSDIPPMAGSPACPAESGGGPTWKSKPYRFIFVRLFVFRQFIAGKWVKRLVVLIHRYAKLTLQNSYQIVVNVKNFLPYLLRWKNFFHC